MELTKEEALAIETVLQPSAWEGVKLLLLDLAQIVVTEKPADVHLTDDELWGILERAPTYPVGFDKIWLGIKKKFYERLLRADFERSIGIPVGEVDSQPDQTRMEIARRELRHARKNSSTNKDSNHQP